MFHGKSLKCPTLGQKTALSKLLFWFNSFFCGPVWLQLGFRGRQKTVFFICAHHCKFYSQILWDFEFFFRLVITTKPAALANHRTRKGQIGLKISRKLFLGRFDDSNSFSSFFFLDCSTFLLSLLKKVGTRYGTDNCWLFLNPDVLLNAIRAEGSA